MVLQWGINMVSYYSSRRKDKVQEIIRNCQRNRERKRHRESGREGESISLYLAKDAHFLAWCTCILYVSVCFGSSNSLPPRSIMIPLKCTFWAPPSDGYPWVLQSGREGTQVCKGTRTWCWLPLSVYFAASDQPPSLDLFPSFSLLKFLPF